MSCEANDEKSLFLSPTTVAPSKLNLFLPVWFALWMILVNNNLITRGKQKKRDNSLTEQIQSLLSSIYFWFTLYWIEAYNWNQSRSRAFFFYDFGIYFNIRRKERLRPRLSICLDDIWCLLFSLLTWTKILASGIVTLVENISLHLTTSITSSIGPLLSSRFYYHIISLSHHHHFVSFCQCVYVTCVQERKQKQTKKKKRKKEIKQQSMQSRIPNAIDKGIRV